MQDRAVKVRAEDKASLPALGGMPVVVSKEYVVATQQSLANLRDLVKSVLERDRDFGRTPGVPGEFLWEPGMDMILNAFNCFVGDTRIVHLVDEPDKISVIVNVPVISRATGTEVGSGSAASSTTEVKHKYRWVEDPAEWGYSEAAIDTLKSRTGDRGTKTYQIPNPERAELLNVIIKQARKRAKSNACQGLPGVSSVLREMFDRKDRRRSRQDAPPEGAHAEWSKFWSEVRALGLTNDQAHEFLGVKSMSDWVAANQGKTLDDAIKILVEKAPKKSDQAPPKAPQPPQGAQAETKIKPRAEWDKITSVKDYPSLEKLFHDFTDLQPREMYKQLGGGSRNDMTINAYEAFLTLKEHYVPNMPEGE